MQFKIHDGTAHEDGFVYLRLVDIEPGHVAVAAVGEDGECLLDPDSDAHAGMILTFTSDGRVSLSPMLMPALGIETDGDGRIKLDEYTEQMTARRLRGIRAVK